MRRSKVVKLVAQRKTLEVCRLSQCVNNGDAIGKHVTASALLKIVFDFFGPAGPSLNGISVLRAETTSVWNADTGAQYMTA